MQPKAFKELEKIEKNHIKDALRNTTDVATAVHNGWVGTSADNFEHNIVNAGERMCETIDQIQEMLRTEIVDILRSSERSRLVRGFGFRILNPSGSSRREN